MENKTASATITISEIIAESRPVDPREIIRQVGGGNLLSISGGRWNPIGYDKLSPNACGVRLPSGSGYYVWVNLAFDDTYTVRRVFERGGQLFVHGTERGVYCDQVGDSAYRASCYRNVDFPSI